MRTSILATLSVMSAGLVACSTSWSGDDPPLGTIGWDDCSDEAAADPELRCATLEVPLDHDNPTGETIDLALVRVPATAERRGAVLFNFGGPGAGGFEPIAVNGAYLQTELGLEHFDLIGFDPRGVDRSAGIRCFDDEEMDVYLNDDDGTDHADGDVTTADDPFAAACTDRYGDTLRHYSTANTARDMDLIRAGLGDEQVSFLGISYGTYLGAVYATLFPDRVRAMVLDSAFDPTGDTVEEQYLTQLVGFEEAFDTWVEWCADSTECAFSSDDVGGRWDRLLDDLDTRPLMLDDGREVNDTVMDTATSASLYAEAEWAVLGSALARAEDGDGEALMAIADAYNGRRPDGSYDTLFQSFEVIRCASGITRQPPDDPEALLAEIRERAPRFGADVTIDDLSDPDPDGCTGLTGLTEPVLTSYDGDAPILVVGGTNDPATPFRWAEEMTASMGPSARLLTYTGEGHGQLLTSTCVTAAEGTLLADLELPADGAVCDPDPVVERPTWFDDIPEVDGLSEVTMLPALNSALGLLDTMAYTEARTTTAEADEMADLLEGALGDAGFDAVGRVDIGIPGTIDINFVTADGEFLIVLLLSPDAFGSDDLAGAVVDVPDGTSVVLFVYLPE